MNPTSEKTLEPNQYLTGDAVADEATGKVGAEWKLSRETGGFVEVYGILYQIPYRRFS
jgi:hypothetical protein